MTKIYLVCREDIEYCSVIGAYSSAEKAQEFIDFTKPLDKVEGLNPRPTEIELDDLDKYLALLKENYKQFHIYLYNDGTYKIEEEKLYHFRPSTYVLNNSHLTKSILKDTVFLYGIVWAKSEEQVVAAIKQKRKELESKGEM